MLVGDGADKFRMTRFMIGQITTRPLTEWGQRPTDQAYKAMDEEENKG